LLELI